MPLRYLWRKQATPAWLKNNETELLARFAERVAFIQELRRKRMLVEICCGQRREVDELIRTFGGKLQRIPKTSSYIHLRPLKIGSHLVVSDRPCRSRSSGCSHLLIPASGAFGTGDHATTAMCLRILERISRRWSKGWSLLDAGTGSGILALAASCFGACLIIAIDNDPKAIAVAKANARANRIDSVRFQIADAVRPRVWGKFDLIVANLFSELLVAAIPNWKPRLKSTGYLILSGVLRGQEREVIRALRKNDFFAEEIRRRGKWIAILARRQKAG